jgi:hypothetical protein
MTLVPILLQHARIEQDKIGPQDKLGRQAHSPSTGFRFVAAPANDGPRDQESPPSSNRIGRRHKPRRLPPLSLSPRYGGIFCRAAATVDLLRLLYQQRQKRRTWSGWSFSSRGLRPPNWTTPGSALGHKTLASRPLPDPTRLRCYCYCYCYCWASRGAAPLSHGVARDAPEGGGPDRSLPCA